jgi:glycosyltransferase involved in cell wall biosynthesis
MDKLSARYKYNCAVIIPTHLPECGGIELASLINTIKVIRGRKVFIMLPEDVSPDFYKNITTEYQHVTVVNLQSGFLGSIENYNRMFLSVEFYKTLQDYKYILICHLDAWIFKDEINEWVSLGYDYIGSPLFIPDLGRARDVWHLSSPVGGNGGLCLRRTKTMINILSNKNIGFNYSLFFKGCFFLLRNRRYDLYKIYIYMIRSIRRNLKVFQKKHNVYEDVMLSVLMPMLNRRIKIAPPEVAAKFALEVNAEEISNSKLKLELPFGVHGIGKHIAKNTFDHLLDKQQVIDKYMYRRNSNDSISELLKPLVSVVTIIKDIVKSGRIEMLEQCIESVQSQTYSNIEHIIIDGASDDGTLEFLEKFRKFKSIKIYSSPDQGIWDAIQKGIIYSKGEYTNILNSDDYFCNNDAILIAVNALIKSSSDWFYSGAEIIRKDGSMFTFPTSIYGVFSCMGIVHQTMFVRRDILLKSCAFTSKYITKENYLMMLLIINGFKVAYNPSSLVHYREGGYSFHEYGGDRLEETKRDFSKYFYFLAGKRWGLTEQECYQMFGWHAFSEKGFAYSFQLGIKLKPIKLKIDFLKRLLSYCANSLSKS